jgi:hypothetical protein
MFSISEYHFIAQGRFIGKKSLKTGQACYSAVLPGLLQNQLFISKKDGISSLFTIL